MVSAIKNFMVWEKMQMVKFERQPVIVKCALIALALSAVVLTCLFAPPAAWGFGTVVIAILKTTIMNVAIPLLLIFTYKTLYFNCSPFRNVVLNAQAKLNNLMENTGRISDYTYYQRNEQIERERKTPAIVSKEKEAEFKEEYKKQLDAVFKQLGLQS